MRTVRYACAISLDGYIAGSDDEFDWMVMDPEFDFRELFDQFDTYLLGRRTYEVTGGHASSGSSGIREFGFSRTLRQQDFKNVTIGGENWQEVVRTLRKRAGKDIWSFGGGSLFRSLAEQGLVDTVEVAIVPVILGGGIPLVAEPATRIELTLKEQRVFRKTGTVSLTYEVNKSGL